jgi:hypothetical protein
VSLNRCPYCGSDKILDEFPNANQGPGNTNYVCGTEIIHLSEDYFAWDCRNGEKPKPIDTKELLRNMDEETRNKLILRLRNIK